MNFDDDRAARTAGTGFGAPGPDAPGTLRDLLALLGEPADDGDAGDAQAELPLAIRHVAADEPLLHEGSSGQTVYLVRSGSFKRLKTLEDGYEQVLSFAWPGELLGFEALHSGVRPSGAVALEESTVHALPVGELAGLQQRHPRIDAGLHRALSRQLARAAESAELMAPLSSDVRVARFVLWMSARMADAGRSSRWLRLPMGRRDIASFLGVAHETVSRSFTALSECGLIRVANREVDIVDLDGLKDRARVTRAPAGPAAARAAHPVQPPARRSTSEARAADWWAALGALAPAG